jgi:hypothetical protein
MNIRPVRVGNGYGGQCSMITGSLPRLSAVGFDNQASSIRFVGTYAGGHKRATLCSDDDYGGSCSSFTADDADLHDNAVGDDRASSVRVEFTCSGEFQFVIDVVLLVYEMVEEYPDFADFKTWFCDFSRTDTPPFDPAFCDLSRSDTPSFNAVA